MGDLPLSNADFLRFFRKNYSTTKGKGDPYGTYLCNHNTHVMMSDVLDGIEEALSMAVNKVGSGNLPVV